MGNCNVEQAIHCNIEGFVTSSSIIFLYTNFQFVWRDSGWPSSLAGRARAVSTTSLVNKPIWHTLHLLIFVHIGFQKRPLGWYTRHATLLPPNLEVYFILKSAYAPVYLSPVDCCYLPVNCLIFIIYLGWVLQGTIYPYIHVSEVEGQCR